MVIGKRDRKAVNRKRDRKAVNASSLYHSHYEHFQVRLQSGGMAAAKLASPPSVSIE
jgi:hypothetical protein